MTALAYDLARVAMRLGVRPPRPTRLWLAGWQQHAAGLHDPWGQRLWLGIEDAFEAADGWRSRAFTKALLERRAP